MNNLATIQRITNLSEAPNSDSLELAQVLGWQVVVKKGEFKIGELVVFVCIDSVLPERPEFEFMRVKHFKLSTCRLRGNVSQGLIFPVSILPSHNYLWTPKEGNDVTEYLGITKYEKQIPIHLIGETKGSFPSYVPRTDEKNLQSYPEAINELRGEKIYISTKIDGTSATFSYKDGEFDVCSRSWSKKEGGNLYWRIAKQYDILEKLKSMDGNYAIQGEIAGEGIQKNPCEIKGQELFVFDIFNIDKQRYLDYADFIHWCRSVLKLETVPNCVEMYYSAYPELNNLLDIARGVSGAIKPYYFNTNNPIEGIVVRSVINKYSQILQGRLSVKVINSAYKN